MEVDRRERAEAEASAAEAALACTSPSLCDDVARTTHELSVAALRGEQARLRGELALRTREAEEARGIVDAGTHLSAFSCFGAELTRICRRRNASQTGPRC